MKNVSPPYDKLISKHLVHDLQTGSLLVCYTNNNLRTVIVYPILDTTVRTKDFFEIFRTEISHSYNFNNISDCWGQRSCQNLSLKGALFSYNVTDWSDICCHWAPLILSCITLKNGQHTVKILQCSHRKISKYDWPVFHIVHKRLTLSDI